MEKKLLYLFLFCVPFIIQAQQLPEYFQPEQDCISATPICGNSYYQPNYYLGFGNSFEILPSENCIVPGEINSVWYVFSIATGGTLGFTINSNVDFDFALWDISIGGCNEIVQSNPIRCNYSGANSPTGLTAATTAPPGLSYGNTQPPIMPGLTVAAGQTYALFVNNLWLNPFTFSGYNITFSGSATLVSAASPPPTLTVEACNIGQPLVVYSSAPIDCNTISASSFTMSGAVVTNVTGIDCGNFSTRLLVSYTLVGAPAASYTLTPSGLSDLCGNNLSAPTNFTFPTPIQLSASPNAICAGTGASVTLTSNLSGTWSTGQTGTSITVTPNATTVYTLEIINGSCSRTESITVTVHPQAYAQITPQNPAVCTGGSAALSVLAPAGSSIVWSGGAFSGSPNGQTIQAAPPTNTLYTVNITTPEGCTASASTMVYSGAPAPDPACVNLYVTPSGSSSGDGTRVDPVDLPTAISLAQCNNAVIKLSVGVYNFDQPIQLFDYITIEGGFLPGSDWQKVSTDGTPATTTIINRTAAGTYPYDGIAGAPALIAVQGNSISNFRLQDLTFTTANAPTTTVEGVSTYGIYLNNCSNYNVVRCRALPGNASAGANGIPGTAGAPGNPGANGGNGCSAAPDIVSSPGLNCSSNVASGAGPGTGSYNAAGVGGGGANAGGQGGKGGWRSFNLGNGLNNGQSGQPGTGPAGGAGGNAGVGNGPTGINIFNCVCDATAITNGINGQPGTPGTSGTPGTPSPITPTYTALFVPGGLGSNGTNGTNGSGGGGGGGGGGQDAQEGFCLPAPPFPGGLCVSADLGSDAGCGGGGGGGGGFLGTGGTGAYSGGGSFGVYLWANGPNGNFIDANAAAGAPGAGGNGGAGGAGGAGGNGGNGGVGIPCSLNCITCLIQNPLPFGPSCLLSLGSPGFPSFQLIPPLISNSNLERDYGNGGNGGAGGVGGAGGAGGNGHPGQAQSVYINGAPLTTNITNFNLTAQPVIQYSGQSCVDTDITFNGPSSQTWNLGANASPATLSGATVTTQYNDIGRNTITYGSNTYTGFVNIVLDYVPEAEIYTTAALIPPTTNQYQACAGDAIDFQALQLGIDYEWEFVTVSGGPAPSPSVYPSNPLNPTENLNGIVFANAGVYNIRHRVKSDCCGWSEWVQIVLNVEPIPDFTIQPNPAYLCGIGTLTLNVIINNPASVNPATILWTPATGLSDPTSLNPTVSGLIATTTYTVLAYNPAGNCFRENTITVNVQNDLQLAATINPANCGPNGSIVINSVLNGIGPYTYAWQPPLTATGSSVSNLAEGMYGVIVTDVTTGCTVFQEYGINPSVTTLQASVKDIVPNCIPGSNNASAEINWLAGVGPFTFTWSGAASGTVTLPAGEQGYILTGLPTGAYSVTVTDGGNANCADIVTFNIPNANPMSLTLLASTGTTACGAADGTASVQASGGTPPSDPFIPQYTYAWSHNPSLNSPDAANLAAGTYTVSVTDDAGCVVSLNITIDDPVPVFTLNPAPNICAGTVVDLATLNGSGNGAFAWYAGGLPPVGTPVTTVSPTATTTYFVVYTENGCTADGSATINVNAAPDFSVNTPPDLCPGESIDLTSLNGSGAGTFSWFDGLPSSGTPITVVSPNATTNYWVLYAEGNCTDSLEVTVVVLPTPVFTITPEATICLGDSFDLSGLNGPEPGTFQWFDGTPSSGSPVTSVSPATDTFYWVLYTENGCSDSLQAQILVAPVPDILVFAPPSVICLDAGSTFDLTTLNALEVNNLSGTFTWYADAGLSTPIPDPTAVSAGGTFYVQFTTDNGGCTDVESVDVETSQLPNPPTGAADVVACDGEPLPNIAVDNPGGGFTVTWYDAPTGGNIVGTGATITAPGSGTFYATLTDNATGCESQAVAVNVLGGTPLILGELEAVCSADLTTYDVLVFPLGGSGVGYTLSAAPYTFYVNADNSFTIVNIPVGTVASATLTDSNGCSITVNLTPADCPCPDITAPAPANVVACPGQPLPQLSIPDPGAGFTVYWYDAPTGGNLLGAGITFDPYSLGTVYAAIVQTPSFCESPRAAITLTENPIVQFSETGTTCAADLSSFSLNIQVSGGSGSGYTVTAAPYTVTNNGGGSYTISGIPNNTTATVSITDSNGCATSGSLSSIDCSCPTIPPPTNPTGATICFGATPVAISVAAPPAGFTISWFDVPAGGTSIGTGASFTPPAPGTYYAQIIETATGCVSLRTPVTLTETTQLTFSIDDLVCSANLDFYNVEITVSGGTTPYTVSSSGYTVTDNGGGSFTLLNVPATTMSAINIADALGCSLPTIDVIPPGCPCPAVAQPTGATNGFSCFGAPLAALSVADQGSGFTVLWFDAATGGNLVGTGVSFVPTAAGTWYAALQDNINGCISTTVPVTLTQNTALVGNFLNSTCAADLSNFSAQISVSGGNAPYTVSAGALSVTDNADGTFTIAGIPDNTTATAQITDAQGCTTTLAIPATDCVCPAVPAPTNPTGNTYCFGQTPTAISVADPGAGFTINWYATPVGGSPIGTGSSFTPAAAGTYYAETVEVVNNCVSTRIPVTLTENAQIVVLQGSSNCSADLTTYSVDITVSGGTAPYTISAGAFAITDNGGGSYTISGIPSNAAATVSVADAVGCSFSSGLNAVNCDCPTIAPPANPTGAFICFGQTPVALSVDDPGAGLTVNWYATATGGSPIGSGNSFTPATPSTYYAEVVNADGCNSTRIPVTLTQGADIGLLQIDGFCAPDLATYSVNLLVSNTSGLVTVTATDDSGLNYPVLDAGGGAYLAQNLPSNYTGNITITVSDATTCTETLVISPISCNCPTVPAPANATSAGVCFGAPIADLCVDDPGANYSVQWYDAPNGAGLLLGTGACFTPPAAGTYYPILVDNVSGCTGNSASATLSIGTAINISQNAPSCAVDLLSYSVNISITGGATPYTVTTASGSVINNGGGNYTVSGIPNNTTTSVSVTDANGCVQTLTLNTINCACASILPPANPADAFVCFGAPLAALTVSNPGAGFVINWYDAPTGGTLLGTGTSFTPPVPGTYYAETEETATSCLSTRVAVTLTQGTAIAITDNGSTCSADLTTYDVSVGITGGTEPYTFNAGAYTVTPVAGGWVVEDITQATSVVLTVTDANGCTASLDLGLTTCNCPTVPTPANPQNNQYCQGSAPTLLSVDAPSAGYVVQWYDAPTGGNLLATGNSFTPTTAGTYYAQLLNTTTDCAGNRIAVTLTQNPLPPAPTAASPNPYCEGAFIQALNASGSGGTLTWYADAALTTSVGTGASFTPQTPTVGNAISYWVAETLNACQGPATQVTVSVIECNCTPPNPPTLNNANQTLCEGEDIMPFTATAAAGLEIRWYVGGVLVQTGATYTPTQAGTVQVTAYNPADGCESVFATASVVLQPLPTANFTLPTTTCVGDAVTITYTGAASASAMVYWDFGAAATPATATGAGAQSVVWNTSGVQTITLTIDDNGCGHTLSLPISVSDVSASITPASATVLQGQSITLTVNAQSALGTALNYTWLHDVNCPDCPSVTLTPTEATTVYTVQVADEYGCNAVAEATINMTPRNEVLIPNAFSPNGDGVNDLFRLTGLNVSQVELHVYNRWGNEVYANVYNDLSQGWNGEYNGKAQELGVYVYYATVTFTDGTQETFKGNVTLMR